MIKIKNIKYCFIKKELYNEKIFGEKAAVLCIFFGFTPTL